MITGKTGVSTNTPKNIMFGAGTIHKGLTWSALTYGLTSDTDIVEGKSYYTRSGNEGSYVYTKVTTPVKTSLSSYYEVTGGGWNFSASCIGATNGGSKMTIKPEFKDVEADGALVLVKGLKVKTGDAIVGQAGTSSDDAYDLIESKANLEAGDYYSNIAFVGKTLDDRNIIVILDNALCTSGFEAEGKNKEAGVGKYTFECHADLDSDLDKLPYHIYYPKASA